MSNPKRISIIDDDEAVREATKGLLRSLGYTAETFDSAESFLSRYDPREVACLIVDIRMGGMTGLELQDRLIERRSPLPIVVITGHGDVPMAVDSMKKGAMDFIQKPFNDEELVALVERMLEHARGTFAQHQQSASRDALLSKQLKFDLVPLKTVWQEGHQQQSGEIIVHVEGAKEALSYKF